MEYRPGKCSACGAEYKIPSSFAHDLAKCKECGGVVHIGPVGGVAPTPAAAPGGPEPARPVPARRVATASAAPAREDARTAGDGAPRAEEASKKGGTLERLKRERQAAAAGAATGGAAATAGARAPAPARAAAAKGGGEARPPRPVRSSGAGAAAVGAGAGARRRGATASRRRGRRGGDEDDAGAEERRGRRGASRKKSPMPLLLGAVSALLLAGAGVYFFVLRKDEPARAAEAAPAAATDEAVAGAPADAAAEPAPAAGAGEADAAPDAAADAAADAPTDGTEAADAAPATPEGADVAAAEPPPAPASSSRDPASVDLTAIEDFGPPPGTSPEEWAAIQALVATFTDPNETVRANRAREDLVEHGRAAFPAILNAFKRIDFSTDEGNRMGDVVQRALTEILHGNNFGWEYGTTPPQVWFNKKVVEKYATNWRMAENDVEYWIKMAKLEEKAPEKARALREEFGGGEEAAEELDELDVD